MARARKSSRPADSGDALQSLAETMIACRDEWVDARRASGVEQEWMAALDHFNGRDTDARDPVDAMTGQVPRGRRDLNNTRRSRVFANLTRPKTLAVYSRISTILTPTDEKNWGIISTPIPDLAEQAESTVEITVGGKPMMRDDGQPVTGADLAKSELETARRKAEGMERLIDDQLTECDYLREEREVIMDACKYGTGILKGPIVRGTVERKWVPVSGVDDSGNPITVHELTIAVKQSPASARLSIWDAYPDPCCGADIQSGQGFWERALLTRRRLREISRGDGYIRDAVLKCLAEEPMPHKAESYEQRMAMRTGRPLPKDSRYEVWTYTGEIRAEYLAALGEELPEDGRQTLSGVVVICQGRVIKGHFNPLETGDLPYDFFTLFPVDGSPWGRGIPHVLMTSQNIFNAGWRQTMDNAGGVVGPIVVMKPGVVPADGVMEVRGRKIFTAPDDAQDVRAVLAVHQIESRIAELVNIMKLARELMDEESNSPMLLQGERGPAPDTVGGMTMLLNSANEFMRSVAKRFDDQITVPHIGRYYDFNMQYSPDPEVKGDFQVAARGTSTLVVRDLQNQAIIQMLALANNPAWAPGIKKWEMLRKAFAANHLSADDFVEQDDVIAGREQQQAQQTPDSAIQVEQLRQQGRMAELQFQRETDMALIEEKRKIAVLDYAKHVKLSEQKMKAMLADTAIRERSKKELYMREQALKMSPANPTNQGI